MPQALGGTVYLAAIPDRGQSEQEIPAADEWPRLAEPTDVGAGLLAASVSPLLADGSLARLPEGESRRL